MIPSSLRLAITTNPGDSLCSLSPGFPCLSSSDPSGTGDPAVAKMFIDLHNCGVISAETVGSYLNNAGMLPSDFDEEREQFLVQNGVFDDRAFAGT